MSHNSHTVPGKTAAPVERFRAIFSASEPFFRAAEEELLSAFPKAVTVQRLGPDAGRLESPTIDIANAAKVCQRRPLVFVRHLMQELVTVPTVDAGHGARHAREAAVKLATEQASRDLSLQVWVSGPSTVRAEGLRATLADEGLRVTRAGCEHILSVCVTRRASAWA